MSDFRFIHCADLHIDSPLRGLQAYEGAPVDRLRRATRDAFQNLITLAIDEAVAFVLIAGDLFDGRWPDMSTGLWTARQFRRLANENSCKSMTTVRSALPCDLTMHQQKTRRDCTQNAF